MVLGAFSTRNRDPITMPLSLFALRGSSFATEGFFVIRSVPLPSHHRRLKSGWSWRAPGTTAASAASSTETGSRPPGRRRLAALLRRCATGTRASSTIAQGDQTIDTGSQVAQADARDQAPSPG